MFEILGLLMVGILAGRLLRNYAFVKKISDYVNVTVCLLVLVLGFTVGSNDNVVEEFGKIMVSSLALSVAGIGGSIFGAFWIGKFINNKYK